MTSFTWAPETHDRDGHPLKGFDEALKGMNSDLTLITEVLHEAISRQAFRESARSVIHRSMLLHAVKHARAEAEKELKSLSDRLEVLRAQTTLPADMPAVGAASGAGASDRPMSSGLAGAFRELSELEDRWASLKEARESLERDPVEWTVRRLRACGIDEVSRVLADSGALRLQKAIATGPF